MSDQYVDIPSGGGVAGVTSLNGETGAVTLVAGTGITITPAGQNITIAATGGGGGLASINADTTAAQLLSVGTSGTDFAIVDAGSGSHVFNLPTASASNRGALSSADWTTFNSKGSGSVTSVSVVTANGFAGSVATATTTPAITLSTTTTSGSVLFSNGTALSQDNSTFFWDNTNKRLGIGTATPASKLEIDNSSTTVVGIINKNIASQTVANYQAQSSSGTTYFSVGPDVIPDENSSYLSVTGTLPAVPTTSGPVGVAMLIRTAGSANFGQTGLAMSFLSGYTGNRITAAMNFFSNVAGTGTSPWNLSNANYGAEGQVSGATAGANVGVAARASGSTLVNIGLLGTCFNANTLNVGCVGSASVATTNVGGYFTLTNAAPTLSITSAIIAENAATGGALFIGRANTVEVIRIDSVGNLGIGTATPNTNLDVVGFIEWSGQKRVSTQFDATTNTTLANVTGLSVTLVAAKTYQFEANLFVDADVAGGSKYAIAGTATATNIIYEIILIDNTTNANTITSRQTALAGAAGQTGTTAGFCKISGLITVNAGGTLTVQFAQNVSSGTSSVLVGSSFIVQQIN